MVCTEHMKQFRLVSALAAILTFPWAHTAAYAQDPTAPPRAETSTPPVVPEVAENATQMEQTAATPPTPAGASTTSQAPAPLDAHAPNTSLTRSELDAQRLDLTIQKIRLERRADIVQLARDRQGRAGPITLMAVGYTIGAFFAIGTLASIGSLQDIKSDIEYGAYDENHDFNDDGRIDERDKREARVNALTFFAISAVHLGFGALGTWWLMKRSEKRSKLDRELLELEADRKILALKLDLALNSQGATGVLRGSF